MSAYVCPFHGATVSRGDVCGACMEAYPNLPNPSEMTGDERAAELEGYKTTLTIPFSMLHERMEKLIGRPVMTHEFAMAWDKLVEESRTQDHPHPIQAIKMLENAGKRVIYVEMPEPEDAQ